MDAIFLDHFDRELAYLREMGSEFASRYPRLAGRLGLDEFQCSDPFVERLLEGFAFMSARIHRRLDAEFPQVTRALIDAVFPHYARPIPSAGIFQLNPAHDEGSLVEGFVVPKGSRLHAEPAIGQQTGCRFDTVNDVHLWPIRVVNFGFVSREARAPFELPRTFHQPEIRGALHLVLETTAVVPWNVIKLDRLRLHFRGGDIAHRIYEVLLARTRHVSACGCATGNRPAVQDWNTLNPGQLQSVGFEEQASLMPGESRVFSGYRLLQDYFVLPEKYLFLDIVGLQSVITKIDGNQLHLVFGFDQTSGKQFDRVSTEHVALHCVPAVNLFQRRSDRIHLNHTQHEHHLVCDRSRPLDYEIWSIERMAAHQAAASQETPCLPLYAPPSSRADTLSAPIYYATERRARVLSEPNHLGDRTGYKGTEIFVSLTGSQSTLPIRELQQLSTLVYCTNRDLPLLIPPMGWRTAFRFEAAAPIANVICLNGPTPPRPPLVGDDGDTAWRLISHLTPNYLTLTDSERGGAAMLREMLQLYCRPDDQAASRRIQGLLQIVQTPIVRRITNERPLTFARGLELELLCDEEAFEGGGAFLLGAVLEQFFARFVSLNSFVETHLVSRSRGSIHRWQARSGTTPLL
jgi:type VI secretion system protein ImpG